MEYRAHVELPIYALNPRLHVWRDRADHRRELLLEDGTWTVVDDAAVIPDTAGIVLPREALQAIGLAILEHLGDRIPSQAEVRVLREWLGIERHRVDVLLHSVSSETGSSDG